MRTWTSRVPTRASDPREHHHEIQSSDHNRAVAGFSSDPYHRDVRASGQGGRGQRRSPATMWSKAPENPWFSFMARPRTFERGSRSERGSPRSIGSSRTPSDISGPSRGPMMERTSALRPSRTISRRHHVTQRWTCPSRGLVLRRRGRHASGGEKSVAGPQPHSV